MDEEKPKGKQDGPGWGKLGLGGPNMIQDGPEVGPRWAQDGPKLSQDGPKLDQDEPKMVQVGSKLDPRWSQEPQVRFVLYFTRFEKPVQVAVVFTCWQGGARLYIYKE